MTTTRPRLGITFVPTMPPEQLRSLAEAADTAGLDELWVWEDCFKESGIAAAAAALAWTERISVGIGLLPVPLRNVALTAMELATLHRMFPGRLEAGVGHGVQPWMEQVGARAASPMTLLEEYAVALRRLLDGEEVTVSGRYVRLDQVKLDWPPLERVRLHLGGAGPKSMALAARLGDGLLLSASLTPEEVSTADEIVTRTRADLPTPPREPHALVMALIVATGPEAAERVTAEVTRWRPDAPAGIGVAGDAAAVAAAVDEMAARGATSVAVQPTQDEPDIEGLVAFLGREVRPLVGGGEG